MKINKLAEFNGHQNPIYKTIAAPQQGRFFSGGGDKMIVEWNIASPEMGIPIARFNFTIYSLCLIDEHNLLIAGTSEGGLHFIDLSNNKDIKYIQLPNEGIFDIQYSSKYGFIVASTTKGNLIVIRLTDLRIIKTIPISTNKIRSISFHDHEPYLYAACSDAKIYVVDLLKMEPVFSFISHQWACNSVLYNPAKDQLITGSKDAHIRIWDIKTEFKLIKNIPAHNYAIYGIAYNPILKIYATASRDKTVKLWDEEMNILVRIHKNDHDGHTNSVNTIYWLNDNQLISAGDDGKLIVWEVLI
jgi:WD40 repeat protein